MESSNSKPIKLKIKKPVIVKSFRLIDFHIYDESAKKEESDSGSDDGTRSKYKKRTDELQFVIQMFGINEKGDTCCIYVNDYLPFFYVKVGDNWDEYTMRSFVLDLQANTKLDNRFKDSIVDFELVDHYKLYGFSGGRKHKFIKLVFKNTVAMNKYKNLWYTYNSEPDAKEYRTRKNIVYQGTSVELYESNIPPLLRYFHIHNISPSGWVSFKMNKVTKSSIPTTTCKYEVICPLKELHSQPEKETRVPYKICSFDIEASSSHGDFPIPIKTYKRFVTNVVDIFIKQMKVLDDSQSKMLLQKMILSAFGYGKFEDIDLVYPKNKPSKKMLEARSNLVLNESLEAVRKTTLEEDNSHLLTIDGIFEQMKENEQYTGTGEDNDNNGEQVESSEYTGQQYGKYKRKPKVKKNSTIIDILLNEEYQRDEKIQIFNEIMTRIFPALKGDEVTFIGSTFLKYGDKEPYLNHCLVVGSCDKVPNVEIECTETEQELLIKWTELIQREDPDIIIGYNIFGFDYEFMFRRAQETYCEREFLLLSRKINEICAKESREKHGELNLEHTKIQIASGEYDLRFAKMTGRLQIDMYAYFRRDFNLSSYKLDDVAGQFISDSVKYVSNSTHPELGDVTELCSKNLMGLNVGDFIHIELTGFTADYFNDGQKFIVADIELNKSVTHIVKGVEETNTYNVIVIKGHYELDNSKSIKWGMAKDDVTPQDIFRLSKGSASDRAIVAKYCIQDCNLVHHLMNKIDVITGYVEMSRICSVPISFLVFRGQGIKLTSYVAKKCRDKDTLMPDLEKTWKEEGYEGAIVLPPKCSMYMDNPVACVDYSSLYPSSMISQNYSHDSKVWSKEYDLDGRLIRVVGEQNKKGEFIYDNLPGYHYINIEFDTYEYLRNPNNPVSKKVKTKVGKMVCRWAQFPDNKKGIMPSILEELLKARKDTRKMIKTEKDPFMQNILDKRQLGYKVTANSLYGQCGSRTSTFYEKDVAASTTATGRMMIIYAKRIIEEVYGDRIYNTVSHGPVRTKAEYVYGDTDSVFFTFNLENADTGEKIRGQPALEMTIEIAQDAAELCTKYLKPPMGLEYEKTLMPFILLSKKRYVGMLYEENPNKGYMKFMGLSLKRRDSCDYLKDVYGGILNILMKGNNIENAIQFLQHSLNDLIEGNVSMDKLAITKALRSGYKNPNQIGHFVLAERIGKRDPGNKPKPGDRMKFVFVVNDTPKALMGDKIETPEFIVENKLKIDYTHYITNQLMKPLQQLFGLALEQIWELQGKSTAIKAYRNELIKLENEFPDTETFMKKKEKYSSAKIKVLLFDSVLNKIYNQKHNIQTIISFFQR
uniref:DNA-directed DNA polymerase n=1 Tax=viral metagenome TaxID=1070528 RepID=A0A6C0J710_9ZZZZ